MYTLAELAKQIQTVLGATADQLAKTTGFIKRQRKLTGAKFVRTLTLGFLQKPAATMEELAQSGVLNEVEMSPQGLDKRFTEEATTFLQQVLEEAVKTVVLAPQPVPIELLNRFAAVWLLDTTVLRLPDELEQVWSGTGGRTTQNLQSSVKVEVGFELTRGQLKGPFLLPGRRADLAGHLPAESFSPGSLRIADLGYFSLVEMAKLGQEGNFWWSRLRNDTLLATPDGQPLSHEELAFTSLKANHQRLERLVLLGEQKLPARLLLERVPTVVAAQRRAQIKNRGRKKGQTPSRKTLALCEFTMLITNVPNTQLSFDEALVLYAARWQIELLFKLWKSHAKLGISRSQKPWRILCEIYAKLLAVLVQHWVILLGCWNHPNRSLIKAAQVIRDLAPLLAISFGQLSKLTKALRIILKSLSHGCRQPSRRKHRNTWKTLIDTKPVWA